MLFIHYNNFFLIYYIIYRILFVEIIQFKYMFYNINNDKSQKKKKILRFNLMIKLNKIKFILIKNSVLFLYCIM